MTHDQSFEQVIKQVYQAMEATTPNRTDASAAGLQSAAERLVQVWQATASQPDTAVVTELGTELAEAGISLKALIQAGRVLRVTTQPPANDAQDGPWAFLTDVLSGYVDGTRRAAQQATIAEMQATQQREDQLRAVIQELSTPIIPIYKGVLVLPLVGAIDSMRSQEITERLLEEIVRQQADMVLIDITGVSVVDTSVANHLIMTAQAVNLLGSRVIFTGISSTIAQTIIQLGVNLGDVVTLSNLQAGMLFALEQLGLEIAELAV